MIFKGPELLSKYIGASEQAVRDMFARSVVRGQWSVVSGQWSVVSGQWSVVSFLGGHLKICKVFIYLNKCQ